MQSMELSEDSKSLLLSSCAHSSSGDRREKSLTDSDSSGVHLVTNTLGLGLLAHPCQESSCSFKSSDFS